MVYGNTRHNFSLISCLHMRCDAVSHCSDSPQCALISCLHMRCDSRNYANFIAPLFNFCCIRSHVCSEMASSPLMGCDFWCEPIGIFMCAYVSHPVRICEPWLCLSATSAYKYVLRQLFSALGRQDAPTACFSSLCVNLKAWEVIILYNASSYTSFSILL